MEKHQFLGLLQRYLDGTATTEEQNFLEIYYKAFSTDSDVTELLNHREKEKLRLSLRAEIQNKIDLTKQPVKINRKWHYTIGAAATILIAFTVGLYLYKQNSLPAPETKLSINRKNDIAPGANKAILTLADGRKISLNDASPGQVAVQGRTAVSKGGDGKLNYDSEDRASTNLYNTLTTPRGGEYQLTLADGTKVWLNAASSIRYPVSFAGANKREVQITGEAYFVVVHNAKQPFKVIANGTEVEDLGTEFNVNAYDDEPAMRTTLVSGSIAVHKNGNSALIVPGMEAVTMNGSSTIKTARADIDEAIAWKNGETIFTNKNIQAIMRQVSRWYDVDVSYKGETPNRRFDGGISRKSNLSAILKVLELNDVHFELQGRKLIITP